MVRQINLKLIISKLHKQGKHTRHTQCTRKAHARHTAGKIPHKACMPCVCVCVSVCIFTYVCMYVYNVYVYVYVYVYVCVCVCIYIHIHIHIHIHIKASMPPRSRRRGKSRWKSTTTAAGQMSEMRVTIKMEMGTQLRMYMHACVQNHSSSPSSYSSRMRSSSGRIGEPLLATVYRPISSPTPP